MLATYKQGHIILFYHLSATAAWLHPTCGGYNIIHA